MKTIINLILLVVLIIVVVRLSNGSISDLKNNVGKSYTTGVKVVKTAATLIDSGVSKIEDVNNK